MLLRYFLLTLSLMAVCAGSPSHAQNYESYVAFTGNDANPCTHGSPCQSFFAALAKTGAGGSISCIDAPLTVIPAFPITIRASVTIDCTGAAYSFVAGGCCNAFTINLPQSDTLQTVRLRGFTINGIGSGGRGIEIDAASIVILEDMKIIQESQQGVADIRTSPGELRITNTAISRNAAAGVGVAGAVGNVAILDNVTLDGNQYGVAAANGNNVTVSRSILSRNSVAGVEGDNGAQIVVDRSTISQNAVGVVSNSSVRISNNNIAFNGTAISGFAGTFGNNRFSGNGSFGTNLTPLGGATSDLGEQ
jgi:hypothetical protein